VLYDVAKYHRDVMFKESKLLYSVSISTGIDITVKISAEPCMISQYECALPLGSIGKY